MESSPVVTPEAPACLFHVQKVLRLATPCIKLHFRPFPYGPATRLSPALPVQDCHNEEIRFQSTAEETACTMQQGRTPGASVCTGSNCDHPQASSASAHDQFSQANHRRPKSTAHDPVWVITGRIPPFAEHGQLGKLRVWQLDSEGTAMRVRQCK